MPLVILSTACADHSLGQPAIPAGRGHRLASSPCPCFPRHRSTGRSGRVPARIAPREGARQRAVRQGEHRHKAACSIAGSDKARSISAAPLLRRQGPPQRHATRPPKPDIVTETGCERAITAQIITASSTRSSSAPISRVAGQHQGDAGDRKRPIISGTAARSASTSSANWRGQRQHDIAWNFSHDWRPRSRRGIEYRTKGVFDFARGLPLHPALRLVERSLRLRRRGMTLGMDQRVRQLDLQADSQPARSACSAGCDQPECSGELLCGFEERRARRRPSSTFHNRAAFSLKPASAL